MKLLSRGAWRTAAPTRTTYPPGPESSSSACSFAASADGKGDGGAYAGRGPDDSFNSRSWLRRKFTIPRTIGYSLWHTGQPMRPERTMRSFTSPVERTSISSRRVDRRQQPNLGDCDMLRLRDRVHHCCRDVLGAHHVLALGETRLGIGIDGVPDVGVHRSRRQERGAHAA